MATKLAPIALFAYERPYHLIETLRTLKANPEARSSELYVFCDAPKSSSHEGGVREVRKIVASIDGFSKVHIHYNTENAGLARSIIFGVTSVLEHHDRVIVLEDDMLTSPHFLKYMNESLQKFVNDDRIISVHGYVYPVKKLLPEAFFLLGADCWGWGTWKRGWNLFNLDGAFLLKELKRRGLIKKFNFNHSYHYDKMLRDQINGKNDSWAIRWYASALIAGKLTIYPGRSLVHNIGNDSSGTHCGSSVTHDTDLSSTPIDLSCVEVVESRQARMAFEDFFRNSQISLLFKVNNGVKKFLRQLLNDQS